MRVAVVGGGITGLAAALRLRDRLGPAAELTVFDQRRVLGGKLRTEALTGRRDTGADGAEVGVERGAESFRLRDPAGGESAAAALVRRVGLADQLTYPAEVPAGLWVDGGLHLIPRGTLLGLPAEPSQVAPVAAVDADRDRDEGRPLLRPGEDVAVGQLVRRRFGDGVVDRLVDPLLGGVYAGRADELSLAMTLPNLATACTTATTLAGAVRAVLAAGPGPAGGPALASVRGGLGRLVAGVAAAGGATVRTGLPVRELARVDGRWRLTVGSTRDPEWCDADAVVLAVPARAAARLLAPVAPEPAGLVGTLDYAGVALVTLALPATVALPAWSGFLVPAGGGVVKAVTFLTTKWPRLAEAGGPVLVRASVGRHREPGPLRLTDAALADRVHDELSRMLGGLPDPLHSHVQRWGGALPQYPPGHPDRVARARAGLPGTLRLAGAGYDGVGIAACVRSGETAADQLATALQESTV